MIDLAAKKNCDQKRKFNVGSPARLLVGGGGGKFCAGVHLKKAPEALGCFLPWVICIAAAEGENTRAHTQCWRRSCNLNQQEESLLITCSPAPTKRFDKFTLFLLARTHIPHSQPGVFIFATRMPARILFSLFCCVQTFRGIRDKKNLSLVIFCSACDDNRATLLFLLMLPAAEAVFAPGGKDEEGTTCRKWSLHTAHGEWSKGSERKN
jgi:hypothetical protein